MPLWQDLESDVEVEGGLGALAAAAAAAAAACQPETPCIRKRKCEQMIMGADSILSQGSLGPLSWLERLEYALGSDKVEMLRKRSLTTPVRLQTGCSGTGCAAYALQDLSLKISLARSKSARNGHTSARCSGMDDSRSSSSRSQVWRSDSDSGSRLQSGLTLLFVRRCAQEVSATSL